MPRNRSIKTLLFCAAGTGGHLFPAQHLAQELQEHYEIIFAGKNLSVNPYFNHKNFRSFEVNAATFSFSKPLSVIKAFCAIVHGFFQSMRLLRRTKPALLIGFGSFFSLPLLLAAKVKRVPIILHEQNLFPGRVNRLFASHALFLASSFIETEKYVKGVVRQVDFPQKEELAPYTKEEAARYFGLKENKRTLLIFGGSQGAHFLNELGLELMPFLKEFQILHFVGKQAQPAEFQEHYKKCGVACCVKSFEPYMQRAYVLAEVALCRGGAATIHELLHAALPAIIIPFPFATEDHQTKNGRFFADVVGGGWCDLQKESAAREIVERLSSQEMLLAKKKKIQDYVINQRGKLPSLATLVNKHMQ